MIVSKIVARACLMIILGAVVVFSLLYQSKVYKGLVDDTKVSFASLVTADHNQFDKDLAKLQKAIDPTLPYDWVFIFSLLALSVFAQLSFKPKLFGVFVVIAILAAAFDGLEDILLHSFASGNTPSPVLFWLQYPKIFFAGLDLIGIFYAILLRS
jgi:hypothetical protein